MSEAQFQADLDPAGIAGPVDGIACGHGRRGDTEAARKERFATRGPVVIVVDEIEGLDPELGRDPLGKLPFLRYREIPLAKRGTGDFVPVHVPDRAKGRGNDDRITCHVAAKGIERDKAAAATHLGICRLRGGGRDAGLREIGAAEIGNRSGTAEDGTEVAGVPVQIPVVTLERNDVAGTREIDDEVVQVDPDATPYIDSAVHGPPLQDLSEA